MTDIRVLKRLKDAEAALDRLKVKEGGGIYLGFAQRTLNPFPLASSGGVWGDIGQPWAVTLLALYATVYVVTTNTGGNYWTVALKDLAGNTLGSFNTSAIAPDTTTRFSVTSLTQPTANNAQLYLQLTATGSPGAIYVYPILGIARTG